MSYEAIVSASERVAWSIQDVLPAQSQLDFSLPFLPDTMVQVDRVGTFLTPGEQLRLNQIFANSYLNLFAFVEEYIAADVLRHALAAQFGDDDAFRGLLRFADEEVKHRMLFQRFGALFTRDFGTPCEVLGNAQAVAAVILDKSPLAVLITTYHLELITQYHYTSSVKGNAQGRLDPLFVSLLRHHWLEESQHARIDRLEIDKMLEYTDDQARRVAVAEYLEILRAFDGLLAEQGRFDCESLARATRRTFDAEERAAIIGAMHQSYRDEFILLGFAHLTFAEFIDGLGPEAAAQVDDARRHFHTKEAP